MENEFQINDCQIKIYKALKKYYQKNGYSPTIRELQKLCSYKSTSSIHSHLKRLEEAEYIKIEKYKSRAIKLL